MLTREKITERYKAAFSGSISLQELRGVQHAKPGDSHRYFKCPCGGTDHYASCAIEFGGLSSSPASVLHCYENGIQWMVKVDAAGIIAAEEQRFNEMLERHADVIGSRVSAAEAFRLHSERGVPVEMLHCEDVAGFDRLMEQHRAASTSGRLTRGPR